jgi:predicted  nucleic acid-binding Zn-ribbon protein
MPIRADDAALRNLLRLQSEDTEIRRLNDRRATLPEAARLSEVNDHLAELDADLEIARKQLNVVEVDQNRLEGEIEMLGSKTSREEQRLFSGGVANPKELSSLQAEVESLKRRRGDLEDKLLEVMVGRDSALATVESLEKERSAAATESEDLTARVAELTGDIDAALADHAARRSEAAGTIDAELLSLYEGIRDSKHGVGAAELVGDTCQGCHTKLPAREVERLRNERGLQRCDNCRRILVVT